MKINKKSLELLFLLVLFLFTFYFWTLPFHDNYFPYGDVDSSTHFAVSDHMGQVNKPMYHLPYYIAFQYGPNSGGKLWYPPQYHLNAAILQIFGGHRVLPIFLFHAIACFSIVFTLYILMRHLFGFLPAMLSSFLLVFSLRDISWYIWGQYPQVMSFGLTPLILYSYYRYLVSFNEDRTKPIYAYLTGILLAIQFFIHIQALLGSGLALVFFTLFFIIKQRKIPFNLKHISVSVLIMIVLLVSFYRFPISETEYSQSQQSIGLRPSKFYLLFKWYEPIRPGKVSEAYTSFRTMHNGLWVIPLFVLGLLFLLIRRENKDLLMLAWFIAFYITIHATIIGAGRVDRFMETEAHVLYPIAIIGLLAIPSFIKSVKYRGYAKYGLAFLFVIFILFTSVKPAYSSLKGAYGGLMRITPEQYEASEWLKDNLPEESNILVQGTAIYTKKKWIRALSHRNILWELDSRGIENRTHAMVDYSDLVKMGNQDAFNALNSWESSFLANSTLLYDKSYIKVYELG